MKNILTSILALVLILATAAAEVNVVEVKGSVGATVAGIEVNVNASAKLGVGAKVNVGYSEGKLKAEFSGALRIGGSFGFEVDVGKTVKTVKEKSEKLGKKLARWLKTPFAW